MALESCASRLARMGLLKNGDIRHMKNRSGFDLANVPSDLSLLAFGIPPAREAESAGGMPKVPKGQGLGRLAR